MRCTRCTGQVNSVKHREEGSCTRRTATCIGLDNDTAEAVPIVGSRPAKYVELGGGLPVLAITGNAENARRVSCPGSLPGSAPVKSLPVLD